MTAGPLAWSPDLTLVLASASPQRRAILAKLGVAHVVLPSYAEELEQGEPHALAAENARRKAAAARSALAAGEAPGGGSAPALREAPGDGSAPALTTRQRAQSVILACDTVVALDGRVYGKPADESEATAHLRALAGRTHEVLGALAISAPDGTLRERTQVTQVTVRPLTSDEVAAYVATGEWRGRAGGYAIQGAGAGLVERIDGELQNVIGLPVSALRALVSGLVPDGGR